VARAAKPGEASTASNKGAGNAASKTRTNDPQRTMADIIDVATHEFSERGLAGAL
jgi:hypothetical protein